jgi:hypothetical protein
MVPYYEEGTRRIYYMSYVKEQAILLSFTHRTEQESKKKKEKTVVCKEQIIGPAHMRFVDRKKREKKEKQRPTFIHSFIEEKKSLVFFAEFLGSFFFLCFLACMLIRCTLTFHCHHRWRLFFRAYFH